MPNHAVRVWWEPLTIYNCFVLRFHCAVEVDSLTVRDVDCDYQDVSYLVRNLFSAGFLGILESFDQLVGLFPKVNHLRYKVISVVRESRIGPAANRST